MEEEEERILSFFRQFLSKKSQPWIGLSFNSPKNSNAQKKHPSILLSFLSALLLLLAYHKERTLPWICSMTAFNKKGEWKEWSGSLSSQKNKIESTSRESWALVNFRTILSKGIPDSFLVTISWVLTLLRFLSAFLRWNVVKNQSQKESCWYLNYSQRYTRFCKVLPIVFNGNQKL